MPATRRAKTAAKVATEAASPISRATRGKKPANDDTTDLAPKKKTSRTTDVKKTPATSRTKAKADAPKTRGRTATTKKEVDLVPAAAPAKGRGRAKTTNAKSVPESESEAIPEPPKRGRGRPASNTAPTTSTSTSRARSVKTTKEKEMEAPKPKPRGRSTKSTVDTSAAEPEEKPKRGRTKKAPAPEPEIKVPKASGRGKRVRVDEPDEEVEEQAESKETTRGGRAAKRVKIIEPEVAEPAPKPATKGRSKKTPATRAALSKKAPAKPAARKAAPAKSARATRTTAKIVEPQVEETAAEASARDEELNEAPKTKRRGRPRKSEIVAAPETAAKEIEQETQAEEMPNPATKARRQTVGKVTTPASAAKGSTAASLEAVNPRRLAAATGAKGRRATMGAQETPKKSNDTSVPASAPAKARGRGRPPKSEPSNEQADEEVSEAASERVGEAIAAISVQTEHMKAQLSPNTTRPSRRQTMAPKPSTPRSQESKSIPVPNTAPAKARGRPKRSLPAAAPVLDAVDASVQESAEEGEEVAELVQPTKESAKFELPLPGTKPSRRQTMAPKPSTPRGRAKKATGAPDTAPPKIVGRGRPRKSATPKTTSAAPALAISPNAAVETPAEPSTKRRGRARKSDVDLDVAVNMTIDVPEDVNEGEAGPNAVAGAVGEPTALGIQTADVLEHPEIKAAIERATQRGLKAVTDLFNGLNAIAAQTTANENLNGEITMTEDDGNAEAASPAAADPIVPEDQDEVATYEIKAQDEDNDSTDDTPIVRETIEISVVEPASPTAEIADNDDDDNDEEMSQTGEYANEPATDIGVLLTTPQQTPGFEDYSRIAGGPSRQSLNEASGTKVSPFLSELSSPIKLTATPASQTPGSPTKMTPINSSPFKLERAPVPPEYPILSISDLTFPSIPSDFPADLSTINEESAMISIIGSPRKSSPLRGSPRKASRPTSRRSSRAPSLGPSSNNGIIKPSSRAGSRAPSLGPAPDLLTPSSPTKGRSSRRSSRARSLGPAVSSPAQGQQPQTIPEDDLDVDAAHGDPMEVDDFDTSLHFSEIIPGRDTSTPYGAGRDFEG